MRDTDVWAERILTFTPNETAESRRIFVRLGRPHTEPGMGGSWRVEIEVLDGMREPLLSHSTGEDPFHALELACQHIALLLSRWEESGRLAWAGGDGTGFGKYS